MSALVAVAFGDAPPAEVLDALGADELVLARDHASPQALLDAAGAARRAVVWLPAWAEPSPALVVEIREWRATAGGASGPAVALAVPRLVCAEASMRLAPRVLLSTPNAVTLHGETPLPVASATTVALAEPLDVRLPDDLQTHLEQINQQTSVAAGLRHAAGRQAAWRDLVATPLALALRGLAAASGSRRAALPRLVLEAYREVLVTAKLWELAHPTPVT